MYNIIKYHIISLNQLKEDIINSFQQKKEWPVPVNEKQRIHSWCRQTVTAWAGVDTLPMLLGELLSPWGVRSAGAWGETTGDW